jgi:hypothetical protein
MKIMMWVWRDYYYYYHQRHNNIIRGWRRVAYMTRVPLSEASKNVRRKGDNGRG